MTTEQSRLIETKNVSLDTLSVIIKALHVNGKQMTLAVFRQLPEGDIETETGSRNPDFKWWGLVRYKIDDNTLWVVAERDQRLYRLAANPRPWSNTDGLRHSVSSCKDKLAREKESLKYYGENIPEFAQEKLKNAARDLDEMQSALADSIAHDANRAATIIEFMQLPQLFIAL